jgi:hypothetical protein
MFQTPSPRIWLPGTEGSYGHTFSGPITRFPHKVRDKVGYQYGMAGRHRPQPCFAVPDHITLGSPSLLPLSSTSSYGKDASSSFEAGKPIPPYLTYHILFDPLIPNRSLDAEAFHLHRHHLPQPFIPHQSMLMSSLPNLVVERSR